ncbi:protein of unknown function [Candidatus Nitrosocosmicus franklandus]|uniref:Uncharacterized protein n=1 Tax=Candidatus Nitrosocosmicus franklandianus TaxID=1798806 RepID=A0A484ICG0_9ARCH|nr:protein of unknown function [Candidatus Nitrosocosmicus franklandus]
MNKGILNIMILTSNLSSVDFYLDIKILIHVYFVSLINSFAILPSQGKACVRIIRLI